MGQCHHLLPASAIAPSLVGGTDTCTRKVAGQMCGSTETWCWRPALEGHGAKCTSFMAGLVESWPFLLLREKTGAGHRCPQPQLLINTMKMWCSSRHGCRL